MNEKIKQSSQPNLKAHAKFLLLTILLLLVYSTMLFSANVYIDPTNTAANQNGSIDNPYNSWTKVTFTSGNNYLQKNGTTYNTSTSISVNSKSNIVIGSYGSGSPAKIVGTGTGGYIVNIASSSNITVKDLEILSTGTWTSCIYISGTNSSNNLIENCNVHGTEWGIRVITASAGNRIMNSTIHDTGDDGIYIKDVSSIEVGSSNIYDVNMKYLVNPDQAYSAGDGIQISSTNNLNFNIHDNTIDHSSMGNKFCIIVYGVNYTGILENNTLIGNGPLVTSGVYLHPTTNTVTVRYNTIKNANYGIYSYANLLDAYYNVFSSNKSGISVQSGYTLNARNNVFYNNTTTAVGSSSSTNVTLKNNIFNITSGAKAINTSGTVTSNNNIFNQEQSSFINGYSTLNAWKNASGNDAASLVGNPSFVSAGSGDFHVQPASLVINKGCNVNLSQDLFGTSVPQSGTPDMGVHEVNGGVPTGNSAPVITNQAFSVPQNSPVGTAVGTVLASDPDAGQLLSYSIISGNTNNAFSINSTTGNITVASALPLQNFNLTVKVTDNGSPVLSSQATVSINVSTSVVNQTPVIANQTFSITQTLGIGSLVGKVVASDPDQGQSLTYSIISGNTNNAFALNASTGNITVATALPLQNFNLTVKVTDNGSPTMYAQAVVTINITAGTVNQPPYLQPYSFTVKQYAPTGTLVGTVVGTDPNQGQTLTYSIVSGNTDNAFNINASTGKITVNNSRALNLKLRNRFLLQVKVADNGNPSMSFTQTITINIVKSKAGDEITVEAITPIYEEPKEMRVYPNPSIDGRFSVSFGKVYENVKLEVFDISGKLIKTMTVTQASKGNMDLSTDPHGTYLIRLNTGEETKTLKAVRN
jgi:hypothetical protein